MIIIFFFVMCKKTIIFVRNLPNISDKKVFVMENSISQIIRERINSFEVGELFTINDFENIKGSKRNNDARFVSVANTD